MKETELSEVFASAIENKATKAVVIYFDENDDLCVEGNVKHFEAIGMMEFAKQHVLFDDYEEESVKFTTSDGVVLLKNEDVRKYIYILESYNKDKKEYYQMGVFDTKEKAIEAMKEAKRELNAWRLEDTWEIEVNEVPFNWYTNNSYL